MKYIFVTDDKLTMFTYNISAPEQSILYKKNYITSNPDHI